MSPGLSGYLGVPRTKPGIQQPQRGFIFSFSLFFSLPSEGSLYAKEFTGPLLEEVKRVVGVSLNGEYVIGMVDMANMRTIKVDDMD